MVHYFPPIYPGEIFCGPVGRFRKHLNENLHSLNKRLFDSPLLQMSIEFPSKLKLFKRNTGSLCCLSIDEIINEHTLYPFYRAFATAEAADRAKRKMIEDPYGNIRCVFGINQSKIPLLHTPKYCYQCALNDFETLGETFWHRVHQLPIPVCVVHGTILQKYIPQSHEIGGLNYFQPGSLNELDDQFRYNSNQLLSEISSLAVEVLLRNYSPNISRSFYDAELTKRGFKASRYDINSLVKTYESLFEVGMISEFQKYYGLKMPLDKYLLSLLYKPERIRDPIRHLLLQVFFNKFQEIDSSSACVSKTPIPALCFNKVSDHYLQAVVRRTESRFCSNARQVVTYYHCECGMVYKTYLQYRSGPIPNAKTKTKIVDYGKLWNDKAKELIETKLSLVKLAKALGVSKRKIKNLIKFSNNPTAIRSGKEDFIKKLHDYRQRWIAGFEKQSGVSPCELRKSFQNIYAWLLNNDREWLIQTNLQYQSIRKTRQLKINWYAFDVETKAMVELSHKKLLLENYPRRITKSVLFRSLHNQRYFSLIRMRSRIPQTMNYIESNAETQKVFKQRVSDKC